MIYKKTHRLEKAARNHAKKIRARGGTVTRTQNTDGSIRLEYTFPQKLNLKAGKKKA